ncbi:MAG: glycosyltransferase family 4 protein [Bacteroidota bacterium]
MLQEFQPQALYAAFDVYPTAKGASTHIYHFAQALFEWKEKGWLHVLGSPKLPLYQQEKDWVITRFYEDISNFLLRTRAYGNHLYALLKGTSLEMAHFRDPWSGFPILHYQEVSSAFPCIYEVNGLPSIELPYRYPRVSPQTLKKIEEMEQFCLNRASAIICPSASIRDHLIRRGCPAQKIKVIYNGADVPETLERPEEAPGQYLLYFGALQSWQGVDSLLKSLPYLSDFEDLKLVICVSNRPKFSRPLVKLAEKLGLSERIIWKYQLPKKELYNWVHFAQLTLAPLRECSRNLEQGCCPLKILESLALATPVIAANIPAVREIMGEEDQFGLLVRPDRPAEMARSIRLMLENPKARKEMGIRGKQHIQEHFLWENKKKELQDHYTRILPP